MGGQSAPGLKTATGKSPVVQWLALHAFTAEGPGSIPGQGTKIPQAAWHGQKKKEATKPPLENRYVDLNAMTRTADFK